MTILSYPNVVSYFVFCMSCCMHAETRPFSINGNEIAFAYKLASICRFRIDLCTTRMSPLAGNK